MKDQAFQATIDEVNDSSFFQHPNIINLLPIIRSSRPAIQKSHPYRIYIKKDYKKLIRARHFVPPHPNIFSTQILPDIKIGMEESLTIRNITSNIPKKYEEFPQIIHPIFDELPR